MPRHSRAPMTMGWRRAQLVAESTATLDRPATEAPMSGASINDLPDSAFAYIEPGGKKDDDGKTVPRSLRHFPIHDAAHVRNALARASQSPFGDKALPKIRAAAKKLGVGAPAAGKREAVEIVETPTVVSTSPTKPTKLRIRLIKAGWSANDRYYSEQVLKRDGPKVFPAGTQNFVDHATDEENENRPSGSLTKLASVQTGPAFWDTADKSLMAEVRVFAPWQEAVTDWAKSGAIGMSIRAYAEGEHGTAEGKEGWIVNALTEGRSVDYVTKPAAGGGIVAVLESIGHGGPSLEEARNVGVWLESRLHLALTQLGDEMYGDGKLTRKERITLSSAIGDALKAWTSRVEADAPDLFSRDIHDEPGGSERPAQEVVETTPDVTPADPPPEPEPVADVLAEPPAEPPEPAPPTPEAPPAEPSAADPPAPATEPAPAGEQPPGTDPAGSASTEETTMSDPPGQQPPTPGTARQVIEAEVAEMRREVALMRAERAARGVLATALSDGWIQPATVNRITESLMTRLPMSGGVLDETELTKMAGRELQLAEQEAAQVLEAAGMGRVKDLGQAGSYGSTTPGIGQADVERRLEESFLALGNSPAIAKRAAKGRD